VCVWWDRGRAVFGKIFTLTYSVNDCRVVFEVASSFILSFYISTARSSPSRAPQRACSEPTIMSTTTRSPTALCATLICLGGFHYGYNVAVVGAASDALTAEFKPTTEVFSLLSAAALLGAVIGSPVSGAVCACFGRRIGTFVGEFLSVAGALGSSLSTDLRVIIGCRVAIGLGVGFCTLAKPLYVHEMLPEERASTVQASFAPTVAVGILAAQVSSSVTSNWRYQLAFGAVAPIILLVVAIIWMRESPAWEATRTRTEPTSQCSESGAALDYHPSPDTANAGSTPLAGRQPPARFASARLPPVALAALLGLANQLTGAYPILVYSPVLARGGTSESAGGDDDGHASMVPIVVSVSNLLGAFLALPLMANLRRRSLLCGGCIVMAACLWWAVVLEQGKGPSVDPTLLALALGGWCFAYEFSVGSGYFVVVSDLARGPSATLTFAIGNSVRFAGEFASSFLFLTAVDAFGVPKTLMFHATLTCLLALALLYALPETHPKFMPKSTWDPEQSSSML
jgi:MFS family permease